MPRWRGLYHFGSALKVEFTDGSKYEDLSKVCETLHFVQLLN